MVGAMLTEAHVSRRRALSVAVSMAMVFCVAFVLVVFGDSHRGDELSNEQHKQMLWKYVKPNNVWDTMPKPVRGPKWHKHVPENNVLAGEPAAEYPTWDYKEEAAHGKKDPLGDVPSVKSPPKYKRGPSGTLVLA